MDLDTGGAQSGVNYDFQGRFQGVLKMSFSTFKMHTKSDKHKSHIRLRIRQQQRYLLT